MGKSKRPIGGICSKCARDLGATAPQPMVVTIWKGLCCVCEKTRDLCSTSDYNWPDGPRAEWD